MDNVNMNSTITQQKDAVNADFDKIEADLDNLKAASDKTSADFNAISQSLHADFDACKKSTINFLYLIKYYFVV